MEATASESLPRHDTSPSGSVDALAFVRCSQLQEGPDITPRQACGGLQKNCKVLSLASLVKRSKVPAYHASLLLDGRHGYCRGSRVSGQSVDALFEAHRHSLIRLLHQQTALIYALQSPASACLLLHLYLLELHSSCCGSHCTYKL